MTEVQQSPHSTFLQRIALIVAPLLAVGMLLFVDLSPGHPQVTRTAAVAVLMALWWITEALPLAATALLPMVLFPLLGIMKGRQVAPIYMNHVIFLFIGGFLVALAMERWQLHRRIALQILMRIGAAPGRILLGFMVATAFLSMWISNTATTMMMIPIAMAVIWQLEENLGAETVARYTVGILLGVAYGASLGGISTIVGSPPNAAFLQIFAIQFPQAPEVSFAAWFLFAFPLSVVFLLLVWLYLRRIYSLPAGQSQPQPGLFKQQYQELGPMSFAERVVLADFIGLALLWLFRADVQVGQVRIPGWSSLFPDPSFIDDGVVAMAMAVILFAIPARHPTTARILDWQAARTLPWHIVLLFGGGFALASGFSASGLSTWLGDQLHALQGLPPLMVVALVCLMITFLTELTSNTATAQILLPILASLSVTLRIHPLLLMIPGAITCSFAFMLPVATPPNAIIFGTNRLRAADMAKTGFLLNLAGVVLITAAVYLWGTLIWDIAPGQFPAWAGR